MTRSIELRTAVPAASRNLLRPSLLAFALCAVIAGNAGAATGGNALAAVPAPAPATPQANGALVDIPFEEFTLPNGLRVIVHTDRKAPIVAVNVWYHVGSKDEPAGRTGFAHLFEHLMFNGSENAPGEFFNPFKEVGATGQNGTTNSDRTNYFENVPTTALDMALFMESDRMGHLLGAIDRKTLDEQRGVVQNEKRQGENEPYGQVFDLLGEKMYPKAHPYHHSVIGSMADLNAASLDDVKSWFKTWYGPNNAVLVLAGDIDVATAKDKVTRYFGDIPASPTMPQPKVDVAAHAADSRSTMTDKVPQARIYRVWNVAEYGQPDLDQLQLFAQVLGGSKSSRLDTRLLRKDKLVDSVSVGAFGSQLGSLFFVMADVKQGGDVARVEAIIDEELKRLLRDGPTKVEVDQARTVFQAGMVRGLERIGGFSGKADALAECKVFTGDAGCFRTSMQTLAAATPASVQAAGDRWLAKGSHTLVVTPGDRVALAEDPAVTPAPAVLPAVDPRFKTVASNVDRKAGVPRTAAYPELKFPALQRAKLANGSTLILAERHDVPVVQMSYQFNGGYSTDVGHALGRSSFAMGLLDEGAGRYDALAFGNRAESLGANLAAAATLDGSSVYLSALKENLDPSLALYADMLRKPHFDQAEIDRVKASWIAGIAQEKAQPDAVAMRVLAPLLYGDGHPYGIPMSGSGTEASIASLTRADLVDYQKAWLRPEGATLVVVGDTTLAEIVPLLDRHLGDWKGVGPAPAAPVVAEVPRPAQPRVYLIDQPGAVQANIFVGELVPSTRDPGATRLDIANAVLGGDFTSRLNMNLREDKHWSYGARSSGGGALGQRPWLASAPVQIDQTAPAMAEMQREISDYIGGRQPATAAEVSRMQAIQIRGLPGQFETASSVLSTIGGIVRYGRPDDYVFKRKAEIEAMTPAQVQAAAETLDPKALTWIVVGDLKQIEAPIRALDLGAVQVIDADGKPVVASAARGTSSRAPAPEPKRAPVPAPDKAVAPPAASK